MLVECIGNTPAHLHSERAKHAYKKNIHQEEVLLQIGQQYLVFGVIFRDNVNLPWFLICEDIDEYPTPHLGDFFKIIDGKLPPGWVFDVTINNVGEIGILPERWANDTRFLEKLINGDQEALYYFYQLQSMYKRIYPHFCDYP